MASKNIELTKTLLQFYDKPVAKVSLELVFSILTVIFFALFAIRPTLLTMSDLIKEIEDKRALDLKLKQKAASLSSVQGEYAALQDRLIVLDQAIPPTPRFEEALAIIEKVASEQKIAISSIQAKEVPKEDDGGVSFSQKVRVSRPVSVTVVGDYPSIRQFTQALRETQRTMTVDSIVFTLAEERGKRRLRATITISIHYFGVDKATAGVKK